MACLLCVFSYHWVNIKISWCHHSLLLGITNLILSTPRTRHFKFPDLGGISWQWEHAKTVAMVNVPQKTDLQWRTSFTLPYVLKSLQHSKIVPSTAQSISPWGALYIWSITFSTEVFNLQVCSSAPWFPIGFLSLFLLLWNSNFVHLLSFLLFLYIVFSLPCCILVSSLMPLKFFNGIILNFWRVFDFVFSFIGDWLLLFIVCLFMAIVPWLFVVLIVLLWYLWVWRSRNH